MILPAPLRRRTADPVLPELLTGGGLAVEKIPCLCVFITLCLGGPSLSIPWTRLWYACAPVYLETGALGT